LDREALGGLSVAIRDWGGAVCIISHNMEFVNALCPEIWNVEAGELTRKGKVAIVEDAFDDVKTSRAGSRAASRLGTPRAGTPVVTAPGTGNNSAVTSAANSAAPSEDENGVPKPRMKKKKKVRRENMLCMPKVKLIAVDITVDP
jgi:elongation factor 3